MFYVCSTQYFQIDQNRISGVIDSVLASSAVDRGFIGGVMDSVLASSAVDRGFIGGVMDGMFVYGRSWIRATIGSNKSLKNWYLLFLR